MRSTGRTTRIVNFAIEQLLSCGNVIVSDHATFEGHPRANHILIDLVYENWNKLHAEKMSWTRLRHSELRSVSTRSNTSETKKSVHFYLEQKSIINEKL